MICECGRCDALGLPYCPLCGANLRPISFPIPIPSELVSLCQDWHNGQTSSMYSVSSTGRIHDEDTLTGLSLELMDVQKACERLPMLPVKEESDTDREKESYARLASKWFAILERWEATLPAKE